MSNKMLALSSRDQNEQNGNAEDFEEEDRGDSKGELKRGKVVVVNEQVPSSLKSLLKKSKDIKSKHNRSVTFNQTVIVFCEELESAQDQGGFFEPPIGHQDSNGLEPDKSNDHLGRFQEDDCAGDADDEHHQEDDHLLDRDGQPERVRNVKSPDRSLTERTLLGNIDSFRKNCSLNGERNDILSDSSQHQHKFDFDLDYVEFDGDIEDYNLKQHLNSNSSYLCSEAISDCESETESTTTTCFEMIDNGTNGKASNIQARNGSSILGLPSNSSGSNSGAARAPADQQQGFKSTTNKSTSARVKVSTIDKSQRRGEQAGHQNRLKQISEQNKTTPSPREQQTLEGALKRHSALLQAGAQSHQLKQQQAYFRQASDLQQERLKSADQQHQQGQPHSKTQAKVPAPSQRAACHICKVIESSSAQKLLLPTGANQTFSPAAQQPQIRVGEQNSYTSQAQAQSQAKLEQQQQEHPVSQKGGLKLWLNQAGGSAFDPSCVSCREVLLASAGGGDKLQVSLQTVPNQQAPKVALDGQRTPLLLVQQQQSAQAQPQPQHHYQLIQLVDQNGNGLKTLSLIRPANLNHQANGGRILITTNQNVRFPNPSAVLSKNNQQVGQRIINFDSNNPLANEVTNPNDQQQKNPQLKLINIPAASLEQLTANKTANQQQFALTSESNLIPISSSSLQHLQQNNNFPLKPTAHLIKNDPTLNMRHHTVYYLRQPLQHPAPNNQVNLVSRLSAPPKSSFPDAHEIRRLDGLKGPPTNQLNLSTLAHRAPAKADTTNIARTNDFNLDDPTFGFSNRPAVKVVATKQSNAGGNILIHDKFVGAKGRPLSMGGSGTQTLDRRLLTQPEAKGNNIPSTNSMSNIHALIAGNKINPQQRIDMLQVGQLSANNQATDLVNLVNSEFMTEDAKSKGKAGGLHKWLKIKLPKI